MDKAKFIEILSEYKNEFHTRWNDEMYKWELIQQFQNNWNINAENFHDMLEQALPNTNLLNSANFFPRLMILAFAKIVPEEVRAMFKNLFDESQDLEQRLKNFKQSADKIKNENGDWTSHYQQENVMSIYLWLKYPEKYFIYKFSECKHFAEELNNDFIPKKGLAEKNVAGCFDFYRKLTNLVKEDKEMTDMFKNALTPECYPDENYNTLIADIVFFAGQKQSKNKQSLSFLEDALNNTNINFKYENKFYNIELSGEKYQIKMRTYNGNYNFISKNELPELKDNIFVAVVYWIQNKPSKIFLCPTTLWKDDTNGIFKEKNYEGLSSGAEWGINLTENKISLLEEYEFSKMIAKLTGTKIVNKEKHYWVLSAGEKAKLWEDFKENSIIAIGWDDWELGDLKEYNDRQNLADKIATIDNQTSNKNNVLCLWQFANDIQIGDVVYIKDGRTKLLGRGIVKSDYKYDSNRETYKHIRNVEWTNIGEWESPYTQPVKTLTDATSFVDEINKMEEMMLNNNESSGITLNISYPKYTKDDYLNEVFQTEEEYENLKNLLLNKKNIILQGCPGVGKSYSAKRLAYSIMGKKDESRIAFIQFHQNYSYEDFIMGYKPCEDGFILSKGVFYEFCKKAEADKDRPYFFIIDEINRGNLSKIFGELLLCIENNYRGFNVTLAYEDKNQLFNVPKNLYIIGMMNTADRSLAMMDYALRRRFSFYKMTPAFANKGFQDYQKNLNNEEFNDVIGTIKQLNAEIEQDDSLGAGFCIGHSYFSNITKETCSTKCLNSIIKYDILPTLEEYWFDDKARYNSWENKLNGVLNANR